MAWSVDAQQESQFTMSMFNKLYFNPAYAGVRGMPSAKIMYRKQWFGFDNAPETMLASFDAPMSNDRVGIGVNIFRSKKGITNRWQAGLAYAYNIKFNDATALRLGVEGNMRYYGIDFTDPSVRITESGDPSILDNTDADQYKGNVGAGFYLTHNNYYLGGSITSILSNNLGFNLDNTIRQAEETAHFYLMAGGVFRVSNRFQLQPNLLGKYVKNAPPDLELSLNMIYENRITTGIGYRVGGTGAGESIDLIVLYQAGQVGIGVSYDFPLSDLSQQTVGSLEAMIRYDLVKETDALVNPRFYF